MTPDGSALHKMGPLYFIPGYNTLQQNYYGILKSGKTCAVFVYPQQASSSTIIRQLIWERYLNIILILFQSNLFFLKTALWLPTLHWIVSSRCIIVANLLLLSCPAIYKRYEITGFPLLLNMILALEGLLVVRFATSLLFLGNGDAITSVMPIVLSIFALVILSLVGIIHQCKSQITAVYLPCKPQKVQ